MSCLLVTKAWRGIFAARRHFGDGNPLWGSTGAGVARGGGGGVERRLIGCSLSRVHLDTFVRVLRVVFFCGEPNTRVEHRQALGAAVGKQGISRVVQMVSIFYDHPCPPPLPPSRVFCDEGSEESIPS